MRTRNLALVILFIFSVSGIALAKSTVDPTVIGVGARPLGMGKAYIAVADDANAVFTNPAGIARIENWQLTSMYTKLLDEITYTLAGGVYPTKYGNFGLGYVGANIGDSYGTRRDPDTGRIIFADGVFSYYNNVLVASYGTYLGEYLDRIPFVNRLDWSDLTGGISLKFFNEGITGTPDATATGFDMDIGLQYKPFESFSLALTQQNTLPFDWGGKVTWATGQSEGIPSTTKAGMALKVLGRGAPYQLWGMDLLAAADVEFTPSRPKKPTLIHGGLEVMPLPYLALRLGLDQAAVAIGGGAVGVSNDFTAGVGLIYAGFRFDYAFHQYTGLEANNTHYFSLSYLGVPRKAKPKVEEKKFIDVESPADKLVTYKESVFVNGRALEPAVREIRILGEPVLVDEKNQFQAEATLSGNGKNPIVVSALDADGKPLQEIKRRVLKLVSFKDVKEGYWAKDVIERIGTLGLVNGYPDGKFKPGGTITRAELATLLVRAKGLELPKTLNRTSFRDLPAKHWAAKYIEVAAKNNIVGGYPDRTFKPSQTVSRAEGVSVITRFALISGPQVVLEKPFADVPLKHWAIRSIAGAKDEGILQYLSGKPFEATKKLTRAETVEMLGRTKFASEKIEELLDWEKGY